MTEEIIKNVYLEGTVTQCLEEPEKWLLGRKDFATRFVGGIHNLSFYDKQYWASAQNDPLRIVETGSKREEVWYPVKMKDAPAYLSINQNGKLQSHEKFDKMMPALYQEIAGRINSINNTIHVRNRTVLRIWYENGDIFRIDQGYPCVVAANLAVEIQDPEAREYISGVVFVLIAEFWKDGCWNNSEFSEIEIFFADERLNTPKTKQMAIDWISKHCKGGFFPLSSKLFGNSEEEFMFVTDVCNC